MAYTDKQIKKAINNLKHRAPIVRYFSGYIVLGQNEIDFEGKCRAIVNGDRVGFCTIEHALGNYGSTFIYPSSCTIMVQPLKK
jgi:hypothetical protein